MWIVFFSIYVFFPMLFFLVFVFELNINVTQYIYICIYKGFIKVIHATIGQNRNGTPFMKQELSQLVLVATVELDYVQRMASLCMR